MAVTITYDLTDVNPGHMRTYLRSMFERFHFRRLGGSVFRYEGVADAQGNIQEDWLNHVAPALMFFRSYILAHNITLTRFSIDTSSVALIDHSEATLLLGSQPQVGASLPLNLAPTNAQAGTGAMITFVNAAIAATP